MKNYFPEGYLINTPSNIQAISNLKSLTDAMNSKTILEAKAVLCDSSHNLYVDLGNIRGIIYRDEGAIGISEGITKDIALISRVNKPVCFTVKDIYTENDQTIAILSRKEAQQLCNEYYISKLTPGDVIEVKITHLEQFGAFCDIGCGIPSLIPIDSISVSRIFHPKDRFKIGDRIKCVVKNIADNGRITLTHKELLGSWQENAAMFSQGETVSGIIRTVEDYGAFIELTPNLAGLAEPRIDIYPGQCASVFIKSIIPEKMKIKLVIIDAFNCDYTIKEPQYFYFGNRLDYWQYSPDCCPKLIESVFENPKNNSICY